MSQARRSAAPVATIRRARLEEVGNLLNFAAGLETPGSPPVAETNFLFPTAQLLVAVDRERILGLLRVEGERRRTITHLLVDPAFQDHAVALSLLAQAMRLSWAAGASEIGGFLPADSPLLRLTEDLGATRGPVYRWVSGPLVEETLFSNPLLQTFSAEAELLAEVEDERRRHARSFPPERRP